MPASARVPRQALFAVRRRSALCSRPLARSVRVRRRALLVDSFSLRVELLYVLANTVISKKFLRPRKIYVMHSNEGG